jgi:hypothetical protein
MTDEETKQLKAENVRMTFTDNEIRDIALTIVRLDKENKLLKKSSRSTEELEQELQKAWEKANMHYRSYVFVFGQVQKLKHENAELKRRLKELEK